MQKQRQIILGTIVLAIIFAGFFFFKDETPTIDRPVKIGALLILSGDAATWGENAQKGLQMAVDEFNQAVGEELIQVITEDTGGDTKKAVSGYRKLVDVDKVDAIVGPLFQTEVAAISPLVVQDNIPVITPSYAPIENRPNPRNPLMIWMDPSTEAAKMAEYVFDQGIRNISVIGSLDSWENEVSNAFADKFENIGGRVVFKDIVQPSANDMRPTVTKALGPNPEAVFIGTYYQFIPTTRILSELEYEGDVFSIEVDSYLASETAAYTTGLQFISPEFYTESFIKTFEEKHGHRPGIPAGQAYDAMNILLSFLSDSGDIEKVLERMQNFDGYNGVSGDIVVTKEHKTLFPTAIFELQNGEAVKID